MRHVHPNLGAPAWGRRKVVYVLALLVTIGFVGGLALLVAGFSVLAVALTWPQVRHLDSVPDMGDPLFSIWRIA